MAHVTSSLRVTNPPGGRSSDIFGSTDDTPSPRKVVRDYQKSKVFNGDCVETNGGIVKTTNGLSVEDHEQERFLSPRHSENTKDRLFGASEGATPSPRRINDTYRSNVFGDEEATSPAGAKSTPKKPTSIVNPITGDKLLCNGDVNKCNGHTNGFANGNGGMTNGHQHMNGDGRHREENGNGVVQQPRNNIRVRAPPGGVSHGIW